MKKLILTFILLFIWPAYGRIFFGTPPDNLTLSQLNGDSRLVYNLAAGEELAGFIYNEVDDIVHLLIHTTAGSYLVSNQEKGTVYDEIAAFGYLTHIRQPVMVASRNGLDFLVVNHIEQDEGFTQIGSFASNLEDDTIAYQVLIDDGVAVITNGQLGRPYQIVSDPVISLSGSVAYSASNSEGQKLIVVNNEEFSTFLDYGFYSFGLYSNDLFYTAQTAEGWVVVKNHEVVSRPFTSIELFTLTNDGRQWAAVVVDNHHQFVVINGEEGLAHDHIFGLTTNRSGSLIGYGVFSNSSRTSSYVINSRRGPVFEDLHTLGFSLLNADFAYWGRENGRWVLVVNNNRYHGYINVLSRPYLADDGSFAYYWLSYNNQHILAITREDGQRRYFNNIIAAQQRNSRLYVLMAQGRELYLTNLVFD
ncbi:MAG: hypothetical protein FWE37_00710 [Spirochaetaceae bacterium]|nr:hypothetical protein [Spirochaetaceae bacterium]